LGVGDRSRHRQRQAEAQADLRQDAEGSSRKTKVLARDQQQGLPVAVERQTVAQFLDRWLETVVKQTTRPRTYDSYAQVIRLYIAPAIGRHQLAKLEPQHV
jgi:integrase